MAEYVMKALTERDSRNTRHYSPVLLEAWQTVRDMEQRSGTVIDFDIASAATSTEEIGNAVYPPARRKLAEHGIRCDGHAARQLTRADYAYYDLLIGMDSYNIRNMNRMCGNDPDGKIRMLMAYTMPSPNDIAPDVADPWYTGNFEATWRDCLSGCLALLKHLYS